MESESFDVLVKGSRNGRTERNTEKGISNDESSAGNGNNADFEHAKMSNPPDRQKPKKKRVTPWSRENEEDFERASEEFDEIQRRRGFFTRTPGHVVDPDWNEPGPSNRVFTRTRAPTPGPGVEPDWNEPGPSNRPPGQATNEKAKKNKVLPWSEEEDKKLHAKYEKLDAAIIQLLEANIQRRNTDTPVLRNATPDLDYDDVGNEQTPYTSISRQGVLPPTRTLQEVNDVWLNYRSLTSTPRQAAASQVSSARETVLEVPSQNLPLSLALAIDRRFVRMLVNREVIMDRYRAEMYEYREFMGGSPENRINQVRASYRQHRRSFPYVDSNRWGRVYMDITENQSHSGHTSVNSSGGSQNTIGQEVALEYPNGRRTSSARPRPDLARAEQEAVAPAEAPEAPVEAPEAPAEAQVPAPVIHQQPVLVVPPAPPNQEERPRGAGGFCCFRR